MREVSKTCSPRLGVPAAKSLPQLSAIVLVALLLTFPLVRHGISSGYDSATHARYQHHFSEQFWRGDLYPRWLAKENKGYGSPIFLVQYPLPYFATALLRPLTAFSIRPDREARELGIFVFLSLAAAGISARYWFVKFSAPLAATLAAMVYISLPYFIVGMYLRAAVGEISALVFMPLSLACCESLGKNRRAVLTLGVSFALLILSNLIVSMLFVPALCTYALCAGGRTGSTLAVTARRLFAAMTLGSGLSSVYLLPVIAYRGLFRLDGMIKNLPDFEPGRYFLYLTHGALDPRAQAAAAAAGALALFAGWNLIKVEGQAIAKLGMAATSLLGMATIVPGVGERLITVSGFRVTSFEPFQAFTGVMLLTFSATLSLGLIAYCRLAAAGDPRPRSLIAIACVAFLLMLPFSAPLWGTAGFLATIQFPFRFGSILAVAVAGLISMSFDCMFKEEVAARRRQLTRFFPALACVVCLGIMTCRVDEAFRAPRRPVQYQEAQDLDVMYRTYVPPQHLAAFAGSIGTTPSSYFAAAAPGDGVFQARLLKGEGKLEVRRENPRRISVSADCRGAARLLIGQLYFPLWKKVSLDGSASDTAPGASSEGLLEVPLVSGMQRFQLVFDGGFPERWGLIVTVLSLLTTVSLLLCPKIKTEAGAP